MQKFGKRLPASLIQSKICWFFIYLPVDQILSRCILVLFHGRHRR